MSGAPNMDAARAEERAFFDRMIRSDDGARRAIGKLKIATTDQFRTALVELITEQPRAEDLIVGVIEAIGWMVGCAAVAIGRSKADGNGLACYLARQIHDVAHREVDWAFGQEDGQTRIVKIATRISDEGAFEVRDAKPEETST
jgi:hypothetical protein